MYYAVFLFQQAGLPETSSSLLANGLQGLVLNIFTLPDMYYMDKWGRRIPMVIGGIGMGISMMLIGIIMKASGVSSFPYRILFCTCNPSDGRESGLRSSYAEDEFHIPVSSGFAHCNRVRLYLRDDVCAHLGMRRLGVYARDIQHEHAQSRHLHDHCYKLVCCMTF
jgi:hypothetical protein